MWFLRSFGWKGKSGPIEMAVQIRVVRTFEVVNGESYLNSVHFSLLSYVTGSE